LLKRHRCDRIEALKDFAIKALIPKKYQKRKMPHNRYVALCMTYIIY
jgi:hypothetical protein